MLHKQQELHSDPPTHVNETPCTSLTPVEMGETGGVRRISEATARQSSQKTMSSGFNETLVQGNKIRIGRCPDVFL